jgi:short-subunit dehydrogenase
MNETNKKLALVTGGTSGIGREVVLGLAGQGYDLIIIARSESKMED